MQLNTVHLSLPQRLYNLSIGLYKFPQALNRMETSSQNLDSEFIPSFRKAINIIKSSAIYNGKVDYKRLKNSDIYAEFRQLTAQLAYFPLDLLRTNDQKLAFWLNLYNALVIDGIIQYNIQRTVHEVRGFFAKVAYIVNGYRFSLDDIEHGILRSNRGHPIVLGTQFSLKDERRRYALDAIDPRIHFALVCGAISCPPISFYTEENIDQQLEQAAHNFISQEVIMNSEKKIIYLSQIFRWYAPDFGGSRWNQLGLGNFAPILRFISTYVTEQNLHELLTKNAGEFRVKFKSYNWGLNLTT